jgi:hypothetical protein
LKNWKLLKLPKKLRRRQAKQRKLLQLRLIRSVDHALHASLFPKIFRVK